jgi:flavin-dependent dehydrogenase
MHPQTFDIAIVGGGLAGLALSIQAANAGYQTVLLEKEQYPFHRVCGEYISLESWDFLQQLGVSLSEMQLPIIKRLQVSAPNGKLFETSLGLGGFGISRYKLDNELALLAKTAGVVVLENHKVAHVDSTNGLFHLQAEGKNIRSRLALGAFGKRSNLDIKWDRPFVRKKPSKLNNYIGVKYHVETQHPDDVIALHNFENGYCGISKIEDNRYCICYLTTAANLSNYHNRIEQMQESVLYKNPHLQQLFTRSRFSFSSPVTISQISFQQKSLVEQQLLMLGDAAGMITPLCGNGMSMALHSSKMAFSCLHAFMQQQITRTQMEQQYQQQWQQTFGWRLRTGRIIQQFFGKPTITNLFVEAFRRFPPLARPLIRLTHGAPF